VNIERASSASQLTAPIADGVSSEERLSPEKLSKLGSIQVTCYRAESKKRAMPFIYSGAPTQPVKEIAERMLKGQGVKNNTRSEASGSCSANMKLTNQVLYD